MRLPVPSAAAAMAATAGGGGGGASDGGGNGGDGRGSDGDGKRPAKWRRVAPVVEAGGGGSAPPPPAPYDTTGRHWRVVARRSGRGASAGHPSCTPSYEMAAAPLTPTFEEGGRSRGTGRRRRWCGGAGAAGAWVGVGCAETWVVISLTSCGGHTRARRTSGTHALTLRALYSRRGRPCPIYAFSSIFSCSRRNSPQARPPPPPAGRRGGCRRQEPAAARRPATAPRRRGGTPRHSARRKRTP